MNNDYNYKYSLLGFDKKLVINNDEILINLYEQGSEIHCSDPIKGLGIIEDLTYKLNFLLEYNNYDTLSCYQYYNSPQKVISILKEAKNILKSIKDKIDANKNISIDHYSFLRKAYLIYKSAAMNQDCWFDMSCGLFFTEKFHNLISESDSKYNRLINNLFKLEDFTLLIPTDIFQFTYKIVSKETSSDLIKELEKYKDRISNNEYNSIIDLNSLNLQDKIYLVIVKED